MLILTSGGGSKLGLPHPLFLESTITTTHDTICPQAPVFEGKVSTSAMWLMFQASTITDQTSALVQIAPIPAFFVYDRLEKYLDTITTLAKVEDLERMDKAYMVHCCAFLHVAMVKYCKNDADIAPPVEVFMTMFGTDARSWAASRICKILRVEDATPPKSQLSNPQAAPAPLPTNPQNSVQEAPPEDTYGMSSTELQNTLILLAKKETNNNTKNQAIIRALQNIIYDDAELCITVQLLTTIQKRKWLGDQPVVTFSMARKGLSSFAVLELPEELIGNMNMTVELLEAVTSTTAKEIHKRYANLFKAGVYSGLSSRAKASIMWIVLLQARHIAAGNITVCAEFQAMLTMLLTKNTAIFHAEVLAALIPQEATKCPFDELQEPGGNRK
eukprot:1835206-Ditylum_brightwellii.AAC.1